MRARRPIGGSGRAPRGTLGDTRFPVRRKGSSARPASASSRGSRELTDRQSGLGWPGVRLGSDPRCRDPWRWGRSVWLLVGAGGCRGNSWAQVGGGGGLDPPHGDGERDRATLGCTLEVELAGQGTLDLEGRRNPRWTLKCDRSPLGRWRRCFL